MDNESHRVFKIQIFLSFGKVAGLDQEEEIQENHMK